MQKHTKHGFWYGFNFAAAILIAFFIFGVPLLFALAEAVGSVDFRASQTTSTSFSINIENPQNVALNAVEFELAYDPAALHILVIEPHGILCEERFIITNTINNASGTALFQCGTVTPFSERVGTVATVHAVPLHTGTTTIRFEEQTHVLAHDGNGSDVTRNRTNLVFSSL